MSVKNEGRINDWIRYVKGNAQNVEPSNSATGQAGTQTREKQGRNGDGSSLSRDESKAEAERTDDTKSVGDEKRSSDDSDDASVKRRVRQRPETRAQMLDRLTNPTISLHEASVILNVCTATVRRYANEGLLPHERTSGGQRRFRLRAIMAYLRETEAKKR